MSSRPIRRTAAERLWARVPQGDAGECWVWPGSTNGRGYGSIGDDDGAKKKVYVHRVAYMDKVGPIPDGLVIDHVRAQGCTSRRCVNPRHLEAITQAENIRRMYALKVSCPSGHPYDEINTRISPKGWRECRTCDRIKHQVRKSRAA